MHSWCCLTLRWQVFWPLTILPLLSPNKQYNDITHKIFSYCHCSPLPLPVHIWISSQSKDLSMRHFVDCACLAASSRPHCAISRWFTWTSLSWWRRRRWELGYRGIQIYLVRLSRGISMQKNGKHCHLTQYGWFHPHGCCCWCQCYWNGCHSYHEGGGQWQRTTEHLIFHSFSLKSHLMQNLVKKPKIPSSPLPPLPSPLLCPHHTFLASLILTSKFMQDRCYSNKAWAKLSGLPPRKSAVVRAD